MSINTFKVDTVQGDAEGIVATITTDISNERQNRVYVAVSEAIHSLVRELGGYLSVSATGNVNEQEGVLGDNINIQISSLLRPSAPTPDAGASAALGSAAIFPPEASTAAPATEDNSPPATQEPVPQPWDVTPVEAKASSPELLAQEVAASAPDPEPAPSAAAPVASPTPDGQPEAVQTPLDPASSSVTSEPTADATQSAPIAEASEVESPVDPTPSSSPVTPQTPDSPEPSSSPPDSPLPTIAEQQATPAEPASGDPVLPPQTVVGPPAEAPQA